MFSSVNSAAMSVWASQEVNDAEQTGAAAVRGGGVSSQLRGEELQNQAKNDGQSAAEGER